MTAAPTIVELPAERTSTGRFRRTAGRYGVHIVLALLMIIWLLPTIGLLVNSLRSSSDISSSGWWTALFPPKGLTLDSYANVLSETDLATGFVNSLFITIPATIIPIFVAAFAAYAFSWMNFPGRNLLFVAVVGLLVVPLQTTFIPILQAFSGISIHFGPLNFDTLNGEFLAVWLAHTGYGLPFAIYLL